MRCKNCTQTNEIQMAINTLGIDNGLCTTCTIKLSIEERFNSNK